MNLYEELRKYVNGRFSSPEGFVYHYTQAPIVKKIISSGYLKLNSHAFLNKKNEFYAELKRGTQLIRDALNKSNNLAKVRPIFDAYIERGLTVYTVSFCQEEKSTFALKRYGDIRIQFKSEFLIQFVKDQRSSLFGSVDYEIDHQRKTIFDMISIYEDCKNISNEPEVDLFDWLTVIIPLLKEEKSHEDNECRIVQAEIRCNGRLVTPLCSQRLTFNRSDVRICS